MPQRRKTYGHLHTGAVATCVLVRRTSTGKIHLCICLRPCRRLNMANRRQRRVCCDRATADVYVHAGSSRVHHTTGC